MVPLSKARAPHRELSGGPVKAVTHHPMTLSAPSKLRRLRLGWESTNPSRPLIAKNAIHGGTASICSPPHSWLLTGVPANKSLDEEDAHGGGAVEAAAFGGERAGLGVAGEDTDAVRVLVGDEHPALGGVEDEVARGSAAGGGSADGGEGSGGGRGGEGVEEVVAAVGEVDIAAVAGEDGVTGAADAGGRAGGEQVDARLEGERAVCLVPGEDVDGGVELVD